MSVLYRPNTPSLKKSAGLPAAIALVLVRVLARFLSHPGFSAILQCGAVISRICLRDRQGWYGDLNYAKDGG